LVNISKFNFKKLFIFLFFVLFIIKDEDLVNNKNIPSIIELLQKDLNAIIFDLEEYSQKKNPLLVFKLK